MIICRMRYCSSQRFGGCGQISMGVLRDIEIWNAHHVPVLHSLYYGTVSKGHLATFLKTSGTGPLGQGQAHFDSARNSKFYLWKGTGTNAVKHKGNLHVREGKISRQAWVQVSSVFSPILPNPGISINWQQSGSFGDSFIFFIILIVRNSPNANKRNSQP